MKTAMTFCSEAFDVVIKSLGCLVIIMIIWLGLVSPPPVDTPNGWNVDFRDDISSVTRIAAAVAISSQKWEVVDFGVVKIATCKEVTLLGLCGRWGKLDW